MIKLKCNCCGGCSKIAIVDSGVFDKKSKGLVICDNCLKYVKGCYGCASAKELIEYIKKQKRKRWWRIWQRN